jgi:hypothetical protein
MEDRHSQESRTFATRRIANHRYQILLNISKRQQRWFTVDEGKIYIKSDLSVARLNPQAYYRNEFYPSPSNEAVVVIRKLWSGANFAYGFRATPAGLTPIPCDSAGSLDSVVWKAIHRHRRSPAHDFHRDRHILRLDRWLDDSRFIVTAHAEIVAPGTRKTIRSVDAICRVDIDRSTVRVL